MLVTDAENFSVDQPINPYYNSSPLDKQKASLEHQAIVNLFKQSDIEVIKVASPPRCQDGIYTANWALIKDGRAVLARLPNARKAEEAYAEQVLTELGLQVTYVPNEYKFSGQGDSLPCGKYLLAGSGYRSDPEAQNFAATTLGYQLVQLHAVPYLDEFNQPIINKVTGWPDSFFYDIDLAIAVINNNLIAYCPEAFTPESQKKIESLDIEKIEVSISEAQNGFACNLVSTGDTVIMSSLAPNLKSDLENHGLRVETTDVTELVKGGGFIRCISLTLA